MVHSVNSSMYIIISYKNIKKNSKTFFITNFYNYTAPPFTQKPVYDPTHYLPDLWPAQLSTSTVYVLFSVASLKPLGQGDRPTNFTPYLVDSLNHLQDDYIPFSSHILFLHYFHSVCQHLTVILVFIYSCFSQISMHFHILRTKYHRSLSFQYNL